MPTKKQIEALKEVNKNLVKSSTNLLSQTVGASGFSGFLIRKALKWVDHKTILKLNQKMTSYMIEKALTDESVRRARNTKDLVKKLKDSQW